MHTTSLKLPNENFYIVIEWCLTVAIQIIWRDVSNNYVIDFESNEIIIRICIICRRKIKKVKLLK